MFDPLKTMNAFASGAQMGGAIRQQQTNAKLAPMVAQGDYKGAAQVAGQRGDLGAAEDYMGKYREALKTASAEQVAQERRMAEGKARLAITGLDVPETDLPMWVQQNAAGMKQLGYDDNQIAQWAQPGALNHGKLQGFVNEVRTIEDLLAQQEYGFQNVQGVGLVRTDPRGGTAELAFAQPPETMTPYQAEQVRLQKARLAMERAATSRSGSMWQSAGEGAIFNQGTGQIRSARGTEGGASGPGGVDPRQIDNDFFKSQGITAQLTQFATGEGVGINQQGAYDNTRPDDQGTADMDQYGVYRGRTRGAGDTKRIGQIRESTSMAVNDLDVLLNESQTLIEEGVPSGAFAKQRTDLGRFNSGLKSATGIDLSGLPFVPNETETAQMGAMESIQTQLALTRTALTKGAISNYEMEMFIQSVPGLSNTPEGNKLILENMRKMQARVIAYGEAADTWDMMFGGVSAANQQTGQSFDQAWAEYTRNNPWFELRGAPVGADPTSGPAAPAGKKGPQPGTIEDGYVFQGGNPADPNSWKPVNGVQ